MKGRFSTLDIGVVVKELKRFLGMRVVNVYDIDNKTYLIRIAKPDEKAVILLESGVRLHSTGFDWPKNPAPSGFSMKMRKHLKGRRFEKIEQLGVDRIVDMQFGSGEAAYHVILELYDRGNIVLTDSEYTILNILRPRTDNSQDVRFAVREQYPVGAAKHHELPSEEKLLQILQSAKEGDTLKRALVSHLDYGPAVLEHCLLEVGLGEGTKIGKGFDIATDMGKLMSAMQVAETLMTTLLLKPCKGHIIQRVDRKPNPKDGEAVQLTTYDEFHPYLFRQLESKSHVEFDMFDSAVDEFFSKLESQKLDMKVLQQEKAAMKKLDNVKKDHEKRINELQKEQETDILRGQLIEINLDLVDQAILVVRSALANQIDWTEINQIVKEAQLNGDPVAKAITGLKLDTNHITLLLHDPPLKPLKVDIDLSLSAYANSRKYFEKKKQAAKKEQKTVEASQKAMKSAEKKTKETLKDAATIASINKTRKTYWFEKFLWFISSENYLVIGGRDQQQNELIVKRYLKPGDLYVHADLHGASSVVIKNPSGDPVPPKTLNEAGTMAICNSAAWDAKVVTSAWWVNHDQVSKTAPSGEYLTTGSFMIRGKKNYLPPSYLVYGFGFVFKLEDGSIERHLGERKVRTTDDDTSSIADTIASETESALTLDDFEEEDLADGVSDDSDEEREVNGDEGVDDMGTSGQASGSTKEADSDGDSDGHGDKASSDEGEGDGGERKETEERGAGGREGAKPKSTPVVEFPDTSINLMHVKGDKYELQRLSSNSSSTADTDSSAIHLGDNVLLSASAMDRSNSRGGGRLSAKQRREMRKAKKNGGMQKNAQGNDDEDAVSWLSEARTSEPKAADSDQRPPETHSSRTADDEEDAAGDEAEGKTKPQPQQPQVPLKRGQKGKLRKMKEKYGDQDEEERRLRMEILASSGSQKEEKRKKGKKGKDDLSAKGGKHGGQPQSGKGGERVVPEIAKPAGFVKEEVADVESDGEQEAMEDGSQQIDDTQIINSLTGQPHPEDELLYAIPCCAPYNSLINYKYKVKLLPGTTKRGKAAKTALNMFQHDKTATMRERDLLRIMKDADLSRNMPGKVKVAAPNLHKR
ncbi:hypothetical protein BaRGS_00003307 [Batillaria attramentaria]|uniref:Nuclear export mediator factor NEMF n=1 Tax=Batillaria attramentaria TaxID=370345 RepID=A0ABD0M1H1_9CAEN